MTSSDLRKLMDDLAKSNEEKEELKQKCHDLENQIDLLQDEKMNLSVEFEQLQAQVSHFAFVIAFSIDRPQSEIDNRP